MYDFGKLVSSTVSLVVFQYFRKRVHKIGGDKIKSDFLILYSQMCQRWEDLSDLMKQYFSKWPVYDVTQLYMCMEMQGRPVNFHVREYEKLIHKFQILYCH